jgi:uncharacterized protein
MMRHIFFLLLLITLSVSTGVYSMDTFFPDFSANICVSLGDAPGASTSSTDSREQACLNEELLKAACNGEIERLHALVAAGAEVNAQDAYGATALIKAAWHGHADVVHALIDAGAQINTYDGWIAFIIAVGKGYANIVKKLIAAGAEVNTKDYDTKRTALMNAVEYGNTAIVEILCEVGVDTTLCDYQGKTAGDLAREKKQHAIVAIIEEYECAGTLGLGPKAAFMGVEPAAQD